MPIPPWTGLPLGVGATRVSTSAQFSQDAWLVMLPEKTLGWTEFTPFTLDSSAGH